MLGIPHPILRNKANAMGMQVWSYIACSRIARKAAYYFIDLFEILGTAFSHWELVVCRRTERALPRMQKPRTFLIGGEGLSVDGSGGPPPHVTFPHASYLLVRILRMQ